MLHSTKLKIFCCCFWLSRNETSSGQTRIWAAVLVLSEITPGRLPQDNKFSGRRFLIKYLCLIFFLTSLRASIISVNLRMCYFEIKPFCTFTGIRLKIVFLSAIFNLSHSFISWRKYYWNKGHFFLNGRMLNVNSNGFPW